MAMLESGKAFDWIRVRLLRLCFVTQGKQGIIPLSLNAGPNTKREKEAPERSGIVSIVY